MGMIGMIDRQKENLRTPLPAGTTLTTIDPVVDVVGLFEIEPGLLRINKDYGWLRAADVLAEGDPDLLADVAAQTHHDRPRPGRQAWHVEELAVGHRGKDGNAGGRHLSLVRQHKARSAGPWISASSSGSPCPTAASAWWTEYEIHGRRARPTFPLTPVAAGLTPRLSASDGRPAQPAPAPEQDVQTDRRPRPRPRCRRPRRSTSARCWLTSSAKF